MIYLVIALLAANVLEAIAFTVVLYRLVTQLTAKIMAPDLHTYSIVNDKKVPKVEPKTDGPRGHVPINRTNMPIDEVDPETIMETLAAGVGRADEYEER